MVLIVYIFVFIFGLCIGSFLNCVICRLEQKKSLNGRSFCPYCKHTLRWLDLIPVFSFLFLKGKCRYCKKKISVQYPLVEVATGLIFLIIFNFHCLLPVGFFSIFNEFLIIQFFNLFFLFYVSSALIIIFVYDLKHYLIPDKVLFPAIVIAFLYRILEFLILNWGLIENWKLKIENSALLLNYFYAIIIGSGFFLAIFLFSRGAAMGFGDVKLAVLMGLVLGFPNILVGLFLAFFFGAIIGVILMVFPFGAAQGKYKKGLKSEIPFGPFLIAGTFIAIFWGSAIINWYLKLSNL